MAVEGDIQPEEVLALYRQENWGQNVPALSEAASLAVRAYLEDEGREMVGGVLPIEEDQLRMSVVAHPDVVWVLSNVPDTIPGPYFLGGTYYPSGVGIWGPRAET